jgi:hypothetical protein
MSHTSGSGIVGHPSSFGYTRGGAFFGSLVRIDSVKKYQQVETRPVLPFTVMSPYPVVPDLMHISTLVSHQEPPTVLCGVAGNELARYDDRNDHAYSKLHRFPSRLPQTARTYILAPV